MQAVAEELMEPCEGAAMYDVHSHLLPAVDDGAANLDASLEMAHAAVGQRISVVVCTPHILPGLYANTGPDIRQRVVALQQQLDVAGIPLKVLAGADNHVIPDFVGGLRSGRLLTLADTRYVLVEPPHHVMPQRLEDMFFALLVAGYVPILTHPERLTWIDGKYDVIARLAEQGVLMQVTSGSLTGRFGRRVRDWAERMLDDGLVHLLASDAHDTTRRPFDLAEGRDVAAKRVGAEEARHLVVTRPGLILDDADPSELPAFSATSDQLVQGNDDDLETAGGRRGRGLGGRLRRFFGR